MEAKERVGLNTSQPGNLLKYLVAKRISVRRLDPLLQYLSITEIGLISSCEDIVYAFIPFPW